MTKARLAAGAALLLMGAAPAPASHILDDVRLLSGDDMQGREIGTPGSARARAYILGRLRQIGLSPMEQPVEGLVRGTPKAGVNVYAVIPGRTKASDKVLVVSAHYDHLGVRNGQIYNGADDDASGVAAVLAAAETFQRTRPQHTVILALFDGEEGGLVGSRAFVKAPPVPLSRIAANLNFDMVARGDKGELYVAGAAHYPFLKARLDALAKRAPVTLKQGHEGPPWKGSDDWTDGSDHFAFHEAKIPFVYFGVEDHPDYHKPTDDFAKIPQDFFRKAVQTVVDAARMMDRDLDDIARESGRNN